MSINIEISVGELLDKITILEIKTERITDPDKLKNINKELSVLKYQWKKSAYSSHNLNSYIHNLKQVNEQLWEIEDAIRNKERDKLFDEQFIKLARSVYFINDKRVAIKLSINTKVRSELIEEKSYSEYRQG